MKKKLLLIHIFFSTAIFSQNQNYFKFKESLRKVVSIQDSLKWFDLKIDSIENNFFYTNVIYGEEIDSTFKWHFLGSTNYSSFSHAGPKFKNPNNYLNNDFKLPESEKELINFLAIDSSGNKEFKMCNFNGIVSKMTVDEKYLLIEEIHNYYGNETSSFYLQHYFFSRK